MVMRALDPISGFTQYIKAPPAGDTLPYPDCFQQGASESLIRAHTKTGPPLRTGLDSPFASAY